MCLCRTCAWSSEFQRLLYTFVWRLQFSQLVDFTAADWHSEYNFFVYNLLIIWHWAAVWYCKIIRFAVVRWQSTCTHLPCILKSYNKCITLIIVTMSYTKTASQTITLVAWILYSNLLGIRIYDMRCTYPRTFFHWRKTMLDHRSYTNIRPLVSIPIIRYRHAPLSHAISAAK